MIAHLINTDVGNRGILSLYLDYRARNFDFLKNSADILLNDIENVLVVTGFPIPPNMIPETDGPPGALAIAKAIQKLGGKVEILSYPEVERALRPFGVPFVRAPDLSKYSVIIGVETPGRGKDGRARSMGGEIITREIFDWVFMEAEKLGVPTIGIGDGGNEVGMGNIEDLIVKHIPLGDLIVSTIETRELVISAVSNWGAYGLVAHLSIETGKDLLSGWDEAFVVRLLVENGLIDGVKREREVSVDGISIEVHRKIIETLELLVVETLNSKLRSASHD